MATWDDLSNFGVKLSAGGGPNGGSIGLTPSVTTPPTDPPTAKTLAYFLGVNNTPGLTPSSQSMGSAFNPAILQTWTNERTAQKASGPTVPVSVDQTNMAKTTPGLPALPTPGLPVPAIPPEPNPAPGRYVPPEGSGLLPVEGQTGWSQSHSTRDPVFRDLNNQQQQAFQSAMHLLNNLPFGTPGDKVKRDSMVQAAQGLLSFAGIGLGHSGNKEDSRSLALRDAQDQTQSAQNTALSQAAAELGLEPNQLLTSWIRSNPNPLMRSPLLEYLQQVRGVATSPNQSGQTDMTFGIPPASGQSTNTEKPQPKKLW